MTPEPDCRMLLLQLIGSLTLCDHMGDVSNDVVMVLKKLGIEWESPEDGQDEWGTLAHQLHEMGVTTLYGSQLWCAEDE
jgi:hypothetical protein